MSNEIITGLHQNVVFVQNLHMNYQIIAQLFVLNVASEIQIVVSKIINSDITNGISNDKKIGLIDYTSSGIHFGRASLRIINEYLSQGFTLATHKISLPKSNKPIVAASNNI